MNLAELCFHLRNRRGMYLHDGRYSTAVSFIEGFNVALDGRPLRGFQQWVARRLLGRESSMHWAYLVVSARVPDVLEGRLRLDEIPADMDGALTEDLLAMIDDFVSQGS